MYVDSHVHLQPHGEQPPVTRQRIEAYVVAARANGVGALAFTEHLFRFQEAYELLHEWWDDDPSNPALSAAAHAYCRDHVSMRVGDYVREIEGAKAAGLPVLLGLEMDWIPGREEALRAFLEPYDWDVVLGSVHWIGAWLIDTRESSVDWAEWQRRDVDGVFAQYGELVADLSASRLCDVLAHPDLPKLHGHRPTSSTALHSTILDAAKGGGCAIELNSNGYNVPVAELYPAPALLERSRSAGLPITLASDAHRPDRVGERFDDLVTVAAGAGYEEYVYFEAREARPRPLTTQPPRPQAAR